MSTSAINLTHSNLSAMVARGDRLTPEQEERYAEFQMAALRAGAKAKSGVEISDEVANESGEIPGGQGHAYLVKLTRQNEALRKALNRFGTHGPNCARVHDHAFACDCGFAAAQAL